MFIYVRFECLVLDFTILVVVGIIFGHFFLHVSVDWVAEEVTMVMSSFQPNRHHHPEESWRPLPTTGQVRGCGDSGGVCHTVQEKRE